MIPIRELFFYGAALILMFVPLGALAAVDDALAQRWAAESFGSGKGVNAGTADSTLTKDWPVDTVANAWKALKRCRDAGNSLDLNLAAAEHYLFMRFRASDSGDTIYRKLPAWYQTAKSAATWANVEQFLQSSSQPVSPTDSGVESWGVKGVERGLKEYQARTGQAPGGGTSAIATALGFSYGKYYYKAAAGAYDPTNGSCGVKEPK